MARDIDLYMNSVYCGFWPLFKIDDFFEEYSVKARELAENIDWDEVILFAIYDYDGESGTFISADFMLIRMSYDRYVELSQSLSENCRLFFVDNK